MPILAALRRTFIDRRFTNMVRYLMDNWLPLAIRDSRWFMRPFFRFAYKNSPKLDEFMEFKSRLYSLTPAYLEGLYQEYDTIGTERQSDLSEPSILYILKHLDRSAASLLDVGCGKGFLLERIAAASGMILHGCDLVDKKPAGEVGYAVGNAELLPFLDKSFDVVTCNHTLEHVQDIRRAVTELKRVARKQIVITLPCQNYFYYTLDLHLHFFPRSGMIEELMQMEEFTITKILGDWVYIGSL